MAKFDMSQTKVLVELFLTKREKRDDGWVRRFYAAVPVASLAAFESQVTRGPDSFPYFDLAIPKPGPFAPFCVTHILDYVLDNGCGITVWAESNRSGGPEWVFTYGNLLSYSICGRFDDRSPEDLARAGGGKCVAASGQKVLCGSPSEQYLPTRARKVIGDYMRQVYKHPDPMVALIDDPSMQPSRNLMFNLTLKQYDGNEQKLMAALRFLGWFLPPSYAVVAMPDGWNGGEFVRLPG